MFTKKKVKPLAQKFVAHRGATNEAPGNTLPHFPENSLPALLEAYHQQVIYVECDIHATNDNQIIVLHDNTLRKTARYNLQMAISLTEVEFNKMIDTDVSQLSYKDHLSQVDIGTYADYLGSRFTGTKIPLLSDFLEQLKNFPERKLVIELKPGDIKIIQLLVPLVKDAKLNSDQLIFISFDFNLIQQCKQNLPSFRHLFLTVAQDEPKPSKVNYHVVKTLADLYKVIQKVKEAKLDGLDLEYDEALTKFIPIVTKHRLLAAVWTYPKDDNVYMATKMLQAGADLINTNQPELLFRELSQESQSLKKYLEIKF